MKAKIAVLTSKKQLANTVWKFAFQMKSPDKIEFESGQYISIVINPVTRRQYSIASSPLKSRNEFEIVVDTKPNGMGTKFLMNLDIKSQIQFIGGIGLFILPKNLSKDLFFIATGTGVAPLKSMIETLILNGKYKKHDIHLHFGTRTLGDLFYVDLFKFYESDGKIDNYETYLSCELDVLDNRNGYVTQFVSLHKKDILETAQYFLCGNGEMIKSVEKLLLSNKVSTANIFYEKFY